MKQVLLTLGMVLTMMLVSVGANAKVLLSEDFQTTSGSAFPDGWMRRDSLTGTSSTTTPASYLWKTNTGGYYNSDAGETSTGQRCAYIYLYPTYMKRDVLFTPQITLSALREAKLKFKLKNSTYVGNMNIYVSTDNGATYRQNVLATGIATGSTWTDYEFSLAAFKPTEEGQTVQIRIAFEANTQATGTSSIYYYLDNVVVEEIQTCKLPEGLYYSNLTNTSATINWALNNPEGDATQVFDYQLVNLSNRADSIEVDSVWCPYNSVDLQNLTIGTKYMFRVRSNCEVNHRGYSDWVEFPFSTLSPAQNPPYHNTFDNSADLPAATFSEHVEVSTSASYAFNGNNSLKFNTTAANNAYMIFPLLNMAANDVEMEFKIRANVATYQVKYYVGFQNDPSDPSTFLPIVSDSINSTSYQTVRFNTANVNDNQSPIMMAIYIAAGYGTSVYVDNVKIHTIPSCTRPEQITVTNYGANTATFDWAMTNAPEVDIIALNLTDSTTTVQTATTHPYTFTGLTGQTDYEFYFVGKCTATDLSDTTDALKLRTLCEPLQNPVFIENFETITASNTAPECWEMGWFSRPSTNTKAAPFQTSTTQKHSGSRAMQLVDQQATSYSYLSSQGLNIDEAGKYNLRFWMYRSTYSTMKYNEGMQFWITPQPADTTGGVMLAYIHREPSLTPVVPGVGWYEYEYNIPVSGLQYVTIVGISEYGSASYFDDFEVRLAPSCPKVHDIMLSDITSNSATMTWTAGKNEPQWIVDYTIRRNGAIVMDSTAVTNAPQFTVNGLEPNTAYTVDGSVRSLCGVGDTGEVVTFSFVGTTPCLPLSQLPYNCGFEADEITTTGSYPMPGCWVRYNDATSTSYNYYPYAYNASSTYPSHSGGKILYHYQYYSTSYGAKPTAIMPAVDTQIYPINTLRVKFWAMQKYATGTSYADGIVVVGVMGNPADINTFVAVDTVNLGQYVASYNEITVNLDTYTGNGSYVALMFPRPASKYNYICIDDLTLEEIPNCADIVGDFTVSNATPTSIRVAISDSTATTWQIRYSTELTDDTVTVTGTLVYDLQGLQDGTAYTVNVRKVCANNQYGAWKLPKTYNTLAYPVNAPYSCGFETVAERNGWSFVSDATVNHFAIGSATEAVHTGTKALYISNDGGDTYEYTNNSGKGTQYAYRPVHFGAAGYQISYNWKCHGESSYDFGKFMICPVSEELAVGAGGTYNTAKGSFPDTLFDVEPVWVSGTNIYPLLNCSTSTNGDNWNSYSRFIDFTNCPGDYNIVIAWNVDGSGGVQPPISIDDIVIEEITCIPPSTINVDGLGSDTAALIFSPAVADAWEVYVDTVEFTLENMKANPFIRTVTTNPVFEMGDLTQNTEYFYTVRAICGAGDTSFWKPVASFRTYCAALPIPYNEGFETESSAACWSMISQLTAGSVGRSTNQHQTGSGSLQIVTATAVSPEFSVDSLIDCMITGYVYSTEDNAVISVGAIADPNDVASFVPCAQITVLNKNTWTEFVSYFSVLAEEDEEFKYAKNIAFAAPENTVYFDQITVDRVAACPKPSEPSFSNITDSSFTLSFTEAGTATQWALYLNGSKQIINQNPVNLTGLRTHANYAVEVASICGAGDTSEVADFGVITTACGKVETPYVCSFEASEGFAPVSSVPATETTFGSACWDVLGYKAGGTYPYAYVSSSSTYIHSGNAGVYMYANNTANAALLALLAPETVDPINTLFVKFWYKNSSVTSTYQRLQIGYMNDPTDVNSFVMVRDLPLVSAWTEYSCRFDTVQHATANARIAFRLAGSTSYGYGYIDDLTIKVLRSCSDPDDPTFSNITENSVSVAFTDTCAAHSNYEYIYGEYGFDKNAATPVSITSKSFNLTGLDDDTEYEVAIRAVCGVGDESNWVSSSFHTKCLPYVVTEENPFAEGFEDAPANSSAKYENVCYSQQFDTLVSTTYYGVRGYTKNASTIYSHGGDECIYMYAYKTYQPNGCYISRKFHLDSEKMYKVSVFVRATSYVSRFRILYGTQDNVDNMIAVTDANITNCTATNSTFAACWEEQVGYIMPETTGDYYIGFKTDFTGTNTYSYIFVDDWSITAIDGCKPVNATVDTATQSSVTVSLSDTLATGEWQYAIADAENEIQNPVTVTTNPFTISGLNHSTNYTIWVRKSCGEGNLSPWTSVQASTACGVVNSFPFHEGFEDNGVDLPICWTTYGDKGSSTSTTAPEWYVVATTATSTYRHDGIHYIRMRGAAGMTASLVSPEITFDANREYSITYYAYQAASTSTYTDNFKVYLSSDPTSIVGATYLGETTYKGTASSAGNKKFSIDFMAPVSGNYYIIFYGDYGNYGYLYLDDITVDMYPACRTPQTAPVVNSTTMTTMNVTVDMKGHDEAQIGYIANASGVTVDNITTFVNTTTGNVVITGLTGATNYMVAYRYLCEDNDTSAWSPMGYGLTTESDCFEPQNLRTIGIIDAHNAAATWGRAPQAIGYEYQLIKNAVVVDSAFVTGDTLRFNNLVPVTVYTLRVRGICSGDTTNWEQIQFSTTRESASIPYVCDFESLTDDALWAFVNHSANTNSYYIGGNASGVTGRALYVSDNNSTNTYSATLDNTTASVLLNMTAGNYLVQFDWMCKGESSYDYAYAYILPATTALTATSCTSIPSGAINLTDGTRMNLNETMKSTSNIIRIPSDNVYQLVFTWHNDASTCNAPSMTIDNIRVDAIECMPMESMTLLGVNPTSASVAVEKYSDETSLEYGIATVNDADSVAQLITIPAGSANDTLRFSNLNTNTNYFVFAREVCDTAHKSPWMAVSFKTLREAQLTPYICSFEDGDDLSKWVINSAQANKFVVGTAAHTRGSKALYISNTNGLTHHYDSASLSVTYAYIPLTFGPGKYDISYDWIGGGETTADYGHVLLMPGNFEPVDGTLATGLSGTAIPATAISLEGADVKKLNLSTSWQNVYTEVEFADSITLNLLVAWRNDGSVGLQPPFAIDNIYITPQGDCRPIALSNVSVDSLAEDAFRLKVKNPNVGATTNVVISSSVALNDTIANITLTNGDSLVFVNNLIPHTYYYYGVTSLCSATESSHTMVGSVRTLCSAITQYPYVEGFEGYKASDKAALTNNCFEVINENPSTAYVYPTTTASYIHGGAQALYVYNASTAATAHQTVILPNMTNLNGKTLTFWHKAYNATSSGYCVMSYGYVTSSGDFTSLKQFDRVTDWREYKDTLNDIPSGARIAFKFDGTYYYYLDDIRINNEVMGNTYNDTICFQSAYNNHGFNFQAGRLAPGDTTFTALIPATVLDEADSLTTVNIHMLYEIYSMSVDTICAGADYSNGDWVIPAENITDGGLYYHTFQSHLGCDSSVAMTLYVQPTHEYVYDTICQGDVCTLEPFDTMMLTQTGAYDAYVPTKFGCIDTLTLRLLVTDSLVVTNATICEGYPYSWEDFGSFSQAGVYRRAVTGLGGCPVMKELHLSVYPADSICNVTFCKGGSVQVADTIISTPGSYELHRINLGACDITYHITATEGPAITADVYDVACEGHEYFGYGISGVTVTKDTVITVNSKTADALCDSVTNVHLTFVATKYGDEHVTINKGETYEWYDNTYSETGNYTETLQSAEGCDSVVTLHLSVVDGLDVVNGVKVDVVPNPVRPGMTAYVYGEFGDVEAVEILNNFGQVVDRFAPSSYPIEVEGLEVEGLYYVRVITRKGEVYTEKLIVK